MGMARTNDPSPRVRGDGRAARSRYLNTVVTLIVAHGAKEEIDTSEWVVSQRAAELTYYASFLALISIAVSIYNDVRFGIVGSILIFLTSLNYWRKPTDGLRRWMDIVSVVSVLLGQLAASTYVVFSARCAYYLFCGLGAA